MRGLHLIGVFERVNRPINAAIYGTADQQLSARGANAAAVKYLTLLNPLLLFSSCVWPRCDCTSYRIRQSKEDMVRHLPQQTYFVNQSELTSLEARVYCARITDEPGKVVAVKQAYVADGVEHPRLLHEGAALVLLRGGYRHCAVCTYP